MNTQTMKTLSSCCLSVLIALLAACAPSAQNVNKVKIAYPNWAEGIAMTHLVTQLLEEMDYQVELTLADPGLIYASLAEGTQDLLLDAWLPITHESYMKQYGDRLDDLGDTFEGARIGLVVPSYMDIGSIEELPEYVDAFGGEIIGIGQGAGIMKRTVEALKAYGLDKYELIPSSGPAMTTALGEAIAKNKGIVITGWQPHWKFARWELKFLDDPKGVYGEAEVIKKIVRKGFASDHPDVASLLSKMKLSGEQLAGLMDVMRDAESDEQKAAAARKWILDNKALVDGWKAAD